MALRMTSAAKLAILGGGGKSGWKSLFAAQTLEIRTGAQPTGANLPATGTLLWTKTLPNPCFADSTDHLVLTGSWSANGSATGQAGWFRFKLTTDTNASSQTEIRVDGSIVQSGSDIAGDMQISNLTIVSGVLNTISAFDILI